MAGYALEEDLRSEATALADAFRLGQVKIQRRLRGVIREGCFGSFVSLAKLEDGGEIQLWLDRASGHDEPIFWCGISYETEERLDSAIKRASAEAQPKLTLAPEDMQEVAEGGLMPKAPLPVGLMNTTICRASRQRWLLYWPIFL